MQDGDEVYSAYKDDEHEWWHGFWREKNRSWDVYLMREIASFPDMDGGEKDNVVKMLGSEKMS